MACKNGFIDVTLNASAIKFVAYIFKSFIVYAIALNMYIFNCSITKHTNTLMRIPGN
jgi:hypothetical protein